MEEPDGHTYRGADYGSTKGRPSPSLAVQQIPGSHHSEASPDGHAQSSARVGDALQTVCVQPIEDHFTKDDGESEGRKEAHNAPRNAAQYSSRRLEEETSGEAEAVPRAVLLFTRQDLVR